MELHVDDLKRQLDKRQKDIQYYREDIVILQNDILKNGISLPKNFEPIQEDVILRDENYEEAAQREEVLRRLNEKKIVVPMFQQVGMDRRDVKRSPSLKVSMAAEAAAVARISTSGKIEMNLQEQIKRLETELEREKYENKVLNEKLVNEKKKFFFLYFLSLFMPIFFLF